MPTLAKREMGPVSKHDGEPQDFAHPGEGPETRVLRGQLHPGFHNGFDFLNLPDQVDNNPPKSAAHHGYVLVFPEQGGNLVRVRSLMSFPLSLTPQLRLMTFWRLVTVAVRRPTKKRRALRRSLTGRISLG